MTTRMIPMLFATVLAVSVMSGFADSRRFFGQNACFAQALPDDINRDASWLLARAKQISENAKRTAYDGTEIWTPAGLTDFYHNRTYPRDFFYLVDAYPECATDVQLKKSISLFFNHQASDGRIPNTVYMDGGEYYWLYDNSQFMVNLVHNYVLRSGDDAFFNTRAAALEQAMAWVPRSPSTHLVTAASPRSMYGFNDVVDVEGDDLFTSLLYFESAGKLRDLYTRVGNTGMAAHWDNQAAQIKTGLQTLYDDSGAFRACGAGGNSSRLSVWGSAFAVHLGATTEAQAEAIGNWLSNNYDGYVQAGQVRHLVEPAYWSGAPNQNVYQNGGYWATPFAWVNGAIRNVNPALANQMLQDVLTDFQKHGIHEVVNYDVGYVNRAAHDGEYCASLAPLITLRKLGVQFTPGYANLALADGVNVEVSSVYNAGGNPNHQAEHLCDGCFGNSNSWIPSNTDSAPWFQIELAEIGRIDMFVFGRDNWSEGLISGNEHIYPNRTGYDDRDVEEIVIRVSADGTTWSEPVYSNPAFPGLGPGDNFVIKLDDPVTCRFVKVDFLSNSACFDEFEIFGTHTEPSTIPGDANEDGKVDDQDASILAAHWQQTGMGWGDGDFDGNGIVNDADASILAANWQESQEGAAVPEPSTVVLLAFGLAGLVALRRR